MTGSLDILEILRRELRVLRIPAHTVAFLSGVSSGRLSKYLAGDRCGAENDVKLRRAFTSLKNLREKARPLPLDYSAHREIQESIELLEANKLQVVVFHEEGGEPHVS